MPNEIIRHLIRIEDLAASEVVELCKRADWYRVHKTRTTLLQSRVAGLFFLQPSTRTRVGFHVAMSRMGGCAVDISDTKYQLGMDNAESLSDTIRSVSSYFDVIVMRHSSLGELEKSATLSSTPIINGGSGDECHPTQTLIDLYAIQRRFNRLDNLRIGIVGDLAGSRSAKSLIKSLSNFSPKEIRLMTLEQLKLPSALVQSFDTNVIVYCSSINTKDLDVLYMAGFPSGIGDSYISPSIRAKFRLTQESLEMLPHHSVVLCPLPRIDEIDDSLDVSQKAGYFIQSMEGLYVRMAVLERYTKCF